MVYHEILVPIVVSAVGLIIVLVKNRNKNNTRPPNIDIEPGKSVIISIWSNTSKNWKRVLLTMDQNHKIHVSKIEL